MRFGIGAGHQIPAWQITAALGLVLPGTGALAQQIPIIGETFAHDPSPIIKDGSNYYYYSTGQGILGRTSTDLSHWSDITSVFAGQPAWTTTDVPGFTGNFWAPTVNFFNGQYHMYYAVSTLGSQTSGIGMATSPTLNPAAAGYGWTDHGPVVESKPGYAYNTIDPSVTTAVDGTMWMTFGSYWNGIYEQQLNPTTGLLLNPAATPIHLSQRFGDTSNESSYISYHNGFYYLFENWGTCCQGISSTYNVRMGRSASINGPFVDASGVGMLSGGGTNFLSAQGNYIGPGQVGIYSEGGKDYVSYHYYNGANNGTPALAIQDLYWSANGWPTTTQSLQWSASTTATTDGAGLWDLSHTNFIYNSAHQVWNASGYGAVTFGATAGAAGVVTLAQDVTTQAITFEPATSGNYTLAGNGFKVHLVTGSTVTTDSNAAITAAITGGTFTKSGASQLTLTGAVNTTNFFARQGTTLLSGTGSLTTANTPVTTANNYSSIGLGANDNAVVTLTNTATLTVAGDFNVGDAGVAGSTLGGTLNVQDSATVNARTLSIGKYVNAVGTVNQSGGVVQEVDNGLPGGDWRIGGSGSTSDAAAVGVYNLSGGSFSTGTNLQVGGYGTGTFRQTGGSASVGANNGGFLSIGRFPGGVGTYDLSTGNGMLNTTAGGPFVIVGEQGRGTLNVGGTSTVNAPGLSIGHLNGATGTVVQTGGTISLGLNGITFGTSAAATGTADTGTFTLSGGTLLTPTITRAQLATVSGTFNFNGGTLKATVGNGVLIPAGLTHAYVQVGGAVIDTNALNTAVSQPLAHDPAVSGIDGGLTKQGAGTLTISNTQAYTGPTNVTAGVLQLQPAPTAPIAGSLAWFDAADGATVSTSGGAVTGWVNKGTAGSSLNAAQGVAGAGPVLTSNALNGKSVLTFNNVTGLLTAGTLGVSGAQDRTVFVVGSRGTGSMFFAHEGPVGQNNLAFGLSSETANAYLYTWGNDVTFGIQPTGASQILASELSNTGTNLTGDLVTGGAITSGSKVVAANTTAGQLYLGYRPGATGSGTLAEVIEYPTALSATQRAQVEQYLNLKWFGNGNILPAVSPVNVSAGATLDVNGATQTVASLSGPAGATVTLGSGTLAFSTATSAAFSGVVGGAGNIVMQGTGTQSLGGADTYTGSTTVTSGTLKTGTNPGTGLFARSTAGVAVAGGATLTMGINAQHTNRTVWTTTGLSLAGTGKLDLGDNDLVVHNADPAVITGWVRSGFNAGATLWTGPGIQSSAAAADTAHRTALGVIPNNDGFGNALYGSGTTLGLFDGTNPSSFDVLVKYTYFGDANLDGMVDGSDYTKIDNAFGGTLTGWLNGDFNYDNRIDGSDYTLIDNAFNTQGGTFSPNASTLTASTLIAPTLVATTTGQVATAVPEPAAAGMVIFAAALLRRRRKHLHVTA